MEVTRTRSKDSKGRLSTQDSPCVTPKSQKMDSILDFTARWMTRWHMTYACNGISFILKMQGNSRICHNTNEPGGHHAEWKKWQSPTVLIPLIWGPRNSQTHRGRAWERRNGIVALWEDEKVLKRNESDGDRTRRVCLTPPCRITPKWSRWSIFHCTYFAMFF